jgi:hypothetical protein
LLAQITNHLPFLGCFRESIAIEKRHKITYQLLTRKRELLSINVFLYPVYPRAINKMRLKLKFVSIFSGCPPLEIGSPLLEKFWAAPMPLN